MRGARFLVVLALVAGLPLVSASPSGAVTLVARGSLNQVQVWGATPGATLELLDAGDAVVATGVADAQGAFIFGVAPEATDDVPAGTGYQVREDSFESNAVDVFAFDFDAPVHPPQSFYDDQDLPFPANYGVISPTSDAGYGYITTRDGTTLSANFMAPIIHFQNGDDGPWPTIINYSGYEPSNPANGSGDAEIALLRAAGFAVVGVNLRGTGCSGGAYSYFERLQGLDGYDVVEAVAAQPWVQQAPTTTAFGPGGPMVGMAGISFPGISQLFVGRTNPPSLAAMSPLSVIADSYRSILYPGGVLNDGFATEWVADREESAEPAGQPWAQNRINGGDTVCAENQRLKLQAPPLVARFEQDLPFEADPGDDLAPATFVDDIEVPTFIAGAFQDEQTGGHWPTMLDAFDAPGEPEPDLKRAILYNGTHSDALGPDLIRDLLEFLDLYVARRAPQFNNLLRQEAPGELEGTFGAPYMLPPRRNINSHAQYEAENDVILRWERGARDSTYCLVQPDPPLPPGPFGEPTPRACVPDGEGDGALFGRFESSWETWPPPGLGGGAQTPAAWFLQPDAGLGASAPDVPDDAARSTSAYTYDPSRDQVTSFSGSQTAIWDKDATYTWGSPPEPNALRFVTEPFAAARAFAGSGSVDLWLRAGAPDTDVEVTLTEVRPDGEETYIQSGWLRASHRAELPTSTPLDVQRSYTAADQVALPAGQLSRARVEIFPFAHIVRPGSRLALTVSAPGGNRPFWRFDALPAPADPTVEIAHSVGHPSRLTLPEVALPTGAAGSTIPVCGDLRSQPCRDVVPSTRPTAVAATIDPGDTADDLDRGIDVTWTAPAATPVTGNDVVALPSGEVLADADASPGHRIAVPVGQPPPVDVAYAVESDVDGDRGARSNASPDVVPEHPFTDVARSAWNVEAVDWVAAWDLASGFDDGTFRNGAKATRGQVITWIWSTFGRPTEGSGTAFVDTAGVVREAARWARGNGIASGFAGNRFRPGQRVTRAQAVAWLWAAAGRPDATTAHGFTDVPATAWYSDALDWADEAAIVTGFAGDTFRPSSDVARGQIASWLHATARELQAA